jgi:hypothetical protein
MFMMTYRKNENLERWNNGIQGEERGNASVAAESQNSTVPSLAPPYAATAGRAIQDYLYYR